MSTWIHFKNPGTGLVERVTVQESVPDVIAVLNRFEGWVPFTQEDGRAWAVMPDAVTSVIEAESS